MFNLLIFIFTLGILIIVHEFGHFIMAKKTGVRVEKFSIGFGPAIFKRKSKETEYSISPVFLGGYVKLAGDNPEEYKGEPYEYFSKSPGKRAAIIFFGPLLNYILGILIFWLVFTIGFPLLTAKVGGLVEGYGAKEAGVLAGDKIIAVDGRKIDFWEDLQKIVQAKNNGTFVKLSILRDNKELFIEAKVRTKEFSSPLGKKHTVGLLGITPGNETIKVRHSLPKAFLLSLKRTGELTVMTYNGLWQVLSGKLSARESVTGPLGIFYITSEAANLGLIPLLQLIAVLSVSLAIFNLLPLPVLDGGHILFLCIEKIRGKPLSLKTEHVITQVGFGLIITLAIFVTYNDIVRFFGDKIMKLFK